MNDTVISQVLASLRQLSQQPHHRSDLFSGFELVLGVVAAGFDAGSSRVSGTGAGSVVSRVL